ncbi:MAG: type IV pilin protein [Pseudomonadales bacterium]
MSNKLPTWKTPRREFRTRQYGMTLIELMIAVAIVAILAAVALPSYDNFVKKSRRSDAASQLMQIMQQQERFFLNNMTYTTDLSDLGYTLSGGGVESESGFYRVTGGTCTGAPITRCVQLTGTALAAQDGDGDMTLNSRGEKTHDGDEGWGH